ncbi:MAG TPA: lytic transglycosylase domain-containing protein [Terriglobales bacterium]|jgi:soluble lytic murein transglycosylase-like protein|nr:lytic transglycosylase domain-containing protein [Terriglobales bacterium]
MQKRLHLALMVTPVIATFLSITLPVQAADPSDNSGALTATTDEYGRRVWVNESTAKPKAVRQTQSWTPSEQRLVYWSSGEHRFKPVPHTSMRAARSAAAEVNRILQSSGQQSAFNFSRGRYTPEQVDAAIEQAASRHNLDPNLVRAVVKVESDFNPNAVSRKGAMGLMQLMPNTARQLNVTNPFDPEQNVDAGVRHLKRLLESYGGDVKLTLAAYNAGQGAVARSAGIPRFTETRKYVKRITDLYYGGSSEVRILGSPSHEPVLVQRDERGVLHISNTD